jgi:hypothetical protein
MGGALNEYVRKQSCLQSLVGNCEGQRPRGRPCRIWEDNIKIELQGDECRSLDWIELTQDRER